MPVAKRSFRASTVVAAGLLLHGLAVAAASAAVPCHVPELRAAVLQQVNAVRARGAYCGGQAFGAAAGLAWNEQLALAASGHSKDMAERNYFEHRSPEGRSVSHRATASRYDWKTVAENIAGGETTVDDVVRGWMQSPEHCANLMEAGFTEVGAACVQRPGSPWGTYWTMVLGRRR